MSAVFIAMTAVCGASILFWVLKNKHGLRSFLLMALQGIISLFAVNIIGLFTGVSVAVNWYTIGATALLGMPGTVGLLTFNFLFM